MTHDDIVERLRSICGEYLRESSTERAEIELLIDDIVEGQDKCDDASHEIRYPRHPRRKVIQVHQATSQISKDDGSTQSLLSTMALCDDGTIWTRKRQQWVMLDDVPQWEVRR